MPDSQFTIFYSWQSDLPSSDTRGLIEDSIKAAVKSLNGIAAVHADRDTQGEYGSPDIVQTIFSKIDECDVFVADVTSVTTYHPFEKDEDKDEKVPKRLKATPNANVMVELGYATQVVGWENIICIMNDDYNHDGEIPFDIEHHRITHYSLKKKSKADVRRDLRDIIASTVMNVMENGKRIRPQFSNICIGSWNPDAKNTDNNLIPYDITNAVSVKTTRDTLLSSAWLLFESILLARVRKVDEVPKFVENKNEDNNILTDKITTKDGIELTPVSQNYLLDFNKWHQVRIQETEIKQIIEKAKNYFSVEITSEFFDFGGLKRKFNIIPGYDEDFDGTEQEKKKYSDYVEFCAIMAKIEMLDMYIKTFDGMILLPLAAKNNSSVSDSDIRITIQIDDSTAEIVYPTEELICEELKGIEGFVYENDLIELALSQNDTIEITNSVDDRLWSIENQQIEANAIFRGGINGQPVYSAEDYVKELTRYIASSDNGNKDIISFYISSLHAKEAKWLSHTILLKPLAETIRLRYSVKSNNSDGNLAGMLELSL